MPEPEPNNSTHKGLPLITESRFNDIYCGNEDYRFEGYIHCYPPTGNKYFHLEQGLMVGSQKVVRLSSFGLLDVENGALPTYVVEKSEDVQGYLFRFCEFSPDA